MANEQLEVEKGGEPFQAGGRGGPIKREKDCSVVPIYPFTLRLNAAARDGQSCEDRALSLT